MWPRELAHYWHNYVPPCRPSRFELDVCTRTLEGMRADLSRRRPRVLILGSTTEYRDWAFEEGCEAVVVDNSPAFHAAITAEITHKNYPQELVVYEDWRSMTVGEDFDLILGDLVIGNVAPEDVEELTTNIAAALAPHGRFLTKSFFHGIREPQFPDLATMFRHYEAELAPRDPFPVLAYDLTMACTSPDNYILDFRDMHAAVARHVATGDASSTTLARYSDLGWGEEMKFAFYVMPVAAWEQMCARHFVSVRRELGPYTWSTDFPYYICGKE